MRGLVSPSSFELASGPAETTEFLAIEECQRLDGDIRDNLELLDYEIRRAFTRILAEVDRSGVDNVVFPRASTTVLLSIAAGLLERAAEKTSKPANTASFVSGAAGAATWAKLLKLRYFVGGEG
jgi:hypothetical protein